MKFFEDVNNALREYTYDYSWYGILKGIIDIVLIVTLVVMLFYAVKSKVKIWRVLIVLAVVLILIAIGEIFNLILFTTLIYFLLFWSCGLFLVVYSQDIRHGLDNMFSSTKVDNIYTSKQEKQEVINILVQTVGYLSKRKIGALITIEREDNLNSYIDKAIDIHSSLTQEILTTIFTPGTACHDGAVIIRKNRIMCAGAYYPSTDKYDIPKFLGTRHRAAIGISERCDAITIVVSEETGNISVTVDGVINLELTTERLEEMLERYLITK